MNVRKIIGFLFALLLSSSAFAIPPETFWTTCTTHIYEWGVLEFEVEDGFTFLNRRGFGNAFPPTVGLEMGLFPKWNHLEACGGFSYTGGDDDPWAFDFKIGVQDEDVFFCGSPAITVALHDWGTKHKAYVTPAGLVVVRTDFNVAEITLGKTLPWTPEGTQLRVFASYYHSNHSMGVVNSGVMGALHFKFLPETYCDGTEYYKYWIRADYQSGRNAEGGGSIGLAYYYKPGVHFTIGPAFFNDFSHNQQWKILVHIELEEMLWGKDKNKGGSKNY